MRGVLVPREELQTARQITFHLGIADKEILVLVSRGRAIEPRRNPIAGSLKFPVARFVAAIGSDDRLIDMIECRDHWQLGAARGDLIVRVEQAKAGVLKLVGLIRDPRLRAKFVAAEFWLQQIERLESIVGDDGRDAATKGRVQSVS